MSRGNRCRGDADLLHMEGAIKIDPSAFLGPTNSFQRLIPVPTSNPAEPDPAGQSGSSYPMI